MSSTDFFEQNVVDRRSTKGAGGPAAMDVVRPVGAEAMPNRPVSDLNLTRMTRHREEMNAQVEEVSASATSLSEMAQALQQIVSTFTLSGDGHGTQAAQASVKGLAAPKAGKGNRAGDRR